MELSLPDIRYGTRPHFLLIGDGSSELDHIALIVEQISGSQPQRCAIVDGVAQLGSRSAPISVVAVIGGSCDLEAERLLEALDLFGDRSGSSAIALIPHGLIDLAVACTRPRNVVILSDYDLDDVADAIDHLAADRPSLLQDVTNDTDSGSRRLRELSCEVERIARSLSALSQGHHFAAERADQAAHRPIDGPFVRVIIRARRLRGQYFDSNLFADPAWDMMLDLMAARLEGNPVAVSSLCIAAAVPATTALRWIGILTEAGIFVRIADREDRRRVHIELSPAASAGLTAYLHSIQALQPAMS